MPLYHWDQSVLNYLTAWCATVVSCLEQLQSTLVERTIHCMAMTVECVEWTVCGVGQYLSVTLTQTPPSPLQYSHIQQVRYHCVWVADAVSFNISTTQIQIPYAGSVSKNVCEGVTLPIMTLIAVSIPSCIAVCLFSCLSGALLYRILSTRCSKRRPEHKPQHYYDTVTLAADSVPSPLQGRTSAGGKNIITTPNQAYDEVILASVPRPLQGSTLADKSNYSK